MKLWFRSVALLTILLPLVASAQLASATNPACHSTTVVNVQDTFYVDVRSSNAWLYQETNHISGLQRGSDSAYVPGDHDACVDDRNVQPDQLVV